MIKGINFQEFPFFFFFEYWLSVLKQTYIVFKTFCVTYVLLEPHDSSPVCWKQENDVILLSGGLVGGGDFGRLNIGRQV